MATVYVEARPKGRIDGSSITDYVVEDHANHVLGTFKTQHDAAERAKSQRHTPLIARVRDLNDKKKPDHWRSASRLTIGCRGTSSGNECASSEVVTGPRVVGGEVMLLAVIATAAAAAGFFVLFLLTAAAIYDNPTGLPD